MSVIAGTRRSMKELADGTIRVQIDIDPRFKTEFMAAFSVIDMPVAIAPLVADFERKEDAPIQAANHTEGALEMVGRPKGGALAKLAGQWCNLGSFFNWIRPVYDRKLGGNGSAFGDWDSDEVCASEFCRHAVLVMCDIDSRAMLDHDPIAAEKFHRLIRLPYAAYLENISA